MKIFITSGPIPDTLKTTHEHKDSINRRIFIHDGTPEELEVSCLVIPVDKLCNPTSEIAKAIFKSDPGLQKKFSAKGRLEMTKCHMTSLQSTTEERAYCCERIIVSAPPANPELGLELILGCIQNSMTLAQKKKKKAIAFTKLSTLYGVEEYVNVTCEAVRKWMEEEEDWFDIVIFCREEEETEEYDKALHKFFPTKNYLYSKSDKTYM